MVAVRAPQDHEHRSRAPITSSAGSIVFHSAKEAQVGIVWIIVIGLIAGFIAKLLSPGPNNPSGFILTAVLGVVGAFLATFIGQAIGWYRLDQGAGLIGATVGAVLVLFIWNRVAASGVLKGRM
jgi:uncharacterized membrane protein YeaQ/YmgE (transglycosylase-associated protein family)